MNIPEWVWLVAPHYNIKDADVERAWADFEYGRFFILDSRTLKEFFFILIARKGIKKAVALCDYIIKEIRIPRSYRAEYKHEYVLHYLNTLSLDRAVQLILLALVYVENDINFIREVIKPFVRKKEVQGVKNVKPINFI